MSDQPSYYAQPYVVIFVGSLLSSPVELGKYLNMQYAEGLEFNGAIGEWAVFKNQGQDQRKPPEARPMKFDDWTIG